MTVRSLVMVGVLTLAASPLVAQESSAPLAPPADSPRQQREGVDRQVDRQSAQQTDRQTGERAQRQARQPMAGQAGQQLDQRLAELLIAGNKGEIALAQVGQERATSEAVKEFAQQMIRDHSDMVDKLQQFTLGPQSGRRAEAGVQRSAGGERRADSPRASAAAREEGETAAETTRERRPSAGDRQVRGAGRASLVAVLKDAGQRCVALNEQELRRYQGAEFDQAFMGVQAAVHLDTLAKLQAFEQYTSGDLQQLLRNAAQTTEAHLQRARNIMQELTTQSAATARRPGEARE